MRMYVPCRAATWSSRGRTSLGLNLARNYGQTLGTPFLLIPNAAAAQPYIRDLQITYFRGFFSGGPDSNRGYPYHDIGPHGVNPLFIPGTFEEEKLRCLPGSGSSTSVFARWRAEAFRSGRRRSSCAHHSTARWGGLLRGCLRCVPLQVEHSPLCAPPLGRVRNSLPHSGRAAAGRSRVPRPRRTAHRRASRSGDRRPCAGQLPGDPCGTRDRARCRLSTNSRWSEDAAGAKSHA